MSRRALQRALLLVASVSVGFVRADEPPVLSPREIVARAGGGVVLIEAKSEGLISQGSGFLVDGEGVIVTCLHVIDGASSIAVSLHDGSRLEDVSVRAFDVETDLAVLVVRLLPGDTAPTILELGDTTLIESGSRILVIGNPLGLEHTATEGIVSAWRKPSEREPAGPRRNEPPTPMLPPSRLLQISASLSQGSSGAPVLNESAEVIGVATSGVLWGLADLNFAVPVDELDALLAQGGAMDLETFREGVDGVRRELARPHFDEGKMAYERGNLQEAADPLERALQLFPRYVEALVLSGRIAMDAGELQVAETRLTLATEIDDYDADAWYYLGEAHHRMALAGGGAAEISRAEAAFERALQIDARHGKAAFELALLQIRKGELDRAEQLLGSAIESEPGLADAYYALGEVHLHHGRIDKAREAFEMALWKDESHALSHFGLARLYMKVEGTPDGVVARYGRASKHWEEFLRLSEGDPSLAEERRIAISYIKEYFPYLLD